jgi:hypothetical protein
MQVIELFLTADTVSQIISELASRYFFSDSSCSQWHSQCSTHTTVALFLAGYSSPSCSDLLKYLQQTGGIIAGLFVTHRDDNHVRNLTLLGKDAERVSSYITHCFNLQLAFGTDEFHYERVSLTA